ncbi:MAG TPA: hypothetical protein VN515_00990 [Terriglobales bacterium]|nr:hypothetical protein [Terriglobales bacterium]
MSRRKTARILVALGALVLLTSAAIHCIGAYPGLSATLRASNLQPPSPDALRAVFLLAGWDWVIVAAVVLLALRYESPLSRPLVLLCAVAVLAEAGLTLAFLGLFIGTILLGTGALLLLAGGLAMARQHS